MSLNIICELSRKYGSNNEFVLAGGGNTSFKDEKYLYVKPSGVALANITENDFVKMDRAIIRRCFELDSYDNIAEREAMVTRLMQFAVIQGNGRRPSVEAPLHEILPFTFVVHLHPGIVNALTCSVNGESKCKELFPQALWVEETDPGYILAKTVFDAAEKYKQEYKNAPSVIFLQNHGVFVAGNSAEEIDAIYENIMNKLAEELKSANVSSTLNVGEIDFETVKNIAPLLRNYLSNNSSACAVKSLAPFKTAKNALTPDHIVYAKSYALVSENPTKEEIEKFEAQHGYKPMVVEVPNKVVFCAGKSAADANVTSQLAADGARVQQMAKAFGEVRYLSDAGRKFIENWEAESYRKSVALGASSGLTGKIAVVTGGAQGFGYGIAEELSKAGATVVIADLNVDGAKKAADTLKGSGGSGAVGVNIADELSVEAMVNSVVKDFGGIDIFVANAGVLKAGSVKTLDKKDWDFVTNVNYTGYFLCVKHVAPVMALQNSVGSSWCDIVQINSKSGLVGSNRNGAYAGGKFGTIGLTQSFALELVTDRIKVNSICPGNFFDGPLWSDPERGLFVQYLNSGKVPGAKTVADVKEFYEKQIPMHRGCNPVDVAKAIIYVVNQQYETGQAVPVTGGQVMLS